MPIMHDLIIDSFLAARQNLNKKQRKNCFELLGYDFMIDEDFRIWLIEINMNPSLHPVSEHHKTMFYKMLNDML